MRYLYIGVAVCVVGALIFIFVRDAEKGGARHMSAQEAARAGGDYLVVHFDQEKGVYDYRYDVATDNVLGGYNLLRHAGTTYALLELYRETGTQAYLDTAQTALRWLLAQKDPCPPPHAALACLYEGDDTKLGGAGLSILALVEAYHATGDERYLTEAQELAAWPMATQSGAGEYTIHKQARDGVLSDHVSLYYPGEVIFGLARLGEATGKSIYTESAARGAGWVITVRDKGVPVEELEHDHWLLYGLNELDRVAPDEVYLKHTQKLVRAIDTLQHKDEVRTEHPEWEGGFYEPPRGTPTATRVEGLTAAYALLMRHSDTEHAELAREIVVRATPFILATHIGPSAAGAYLKPDRALGGFTGSLTDTEVRIDYVQHSISALIHAVPILE